MRAIDDVAGLIGSRVDRRCDREYPRRNNAPGKLFGEAECALADPEGKA